MQPTNVVCIFARVGHWSGSSTIFSAAIDTISIIFFVHSQLIANVSMLGCRNQFRPHSLIHCRTLCLPHWSSRQWYCGRLESHHSSCIQPTCGVCDYAWLDHCSGRWWSSGRQWYCGRQSSCIQPTHGVYAWVDHWSGRQWSQWGMR